MLISIAKNGMRFTNEDELRDRYSRFDSEKHYGVSVKLLPDAIPAALKQHMEALWLIPQAVGDSVLIRQTNALQTLNCLILHILKYARSRRPQAKAKSGKESTNDAIAAT